MLGVPYVRLRLVDSLRLVYQILCVAILDARLGFYEFIMNKSCLFWVIGAILVGIGVFFSFRPVKNEDTKVQILKRHVTYSLLVRNTQQNVLQSAVVRIFSPNKKTSFQEVIEISSNYPSGTIVDDTKNQTLQYQFTDLPPFGRKIIKIDATVAFRDKPEILGAEESATYLQKEQFVELDDSRIITQANKLIGKNNLDSLMNIYLFVTNAIEKKPYSKNRKGALYTLLHKSGDCTEFMYLFIALSRINNIPSRSASGFIIGQDQKLLPENYHDWVEVLSEGSWRIIDPFYNSFMENENRYMTMQVQSPAGNLTKTKRFSADTPFLQISMTP
jgi:hypothetical protein